MIRKKREQKTNLKIDFHTHILPAIDDGSKSVTQSMELLLSAKEIGFDTVLATSHFYPHRCNVAEFLKNRDAAYAQIDKTADIPNIICGAEVLVCEGMEDMVRLEELCIGDSNTMLIELPFDDVNVTERMFETVENIVSEKKLNVILAHPNRYSSYIVENMLSIGVRLQINISHLCIRSERSRAMRWLESGYVYAIGSDMHTNNKAYDDLKRVERYFEKYTDDINRRSQELLRSKNVSDKFCIYE